MDPGVSHEHAKLIADIGRNRSVDEGSEADVCRSPFDGRNGSVFAFRRLLELFVVLYKYAAVR